MQVSNLPVVAYFSMEIALDQNIPTYSGGLGVLAGDTLRSASDLAAPLIGVTLAHRKGYFRQRIDENGQQYEAPQEWSPEHMLEQVDARATIFIEGRSVTVRAWKFVVNGARGYKLPVYLLDTDLPENSPWDRRLTDSLYGGDLHYRLCQEVILGVGGFELLRKMGHSVHTYHMNEGHSALLALQLLERTVGDRFGSDLKDVDIELVRQRCVFTTHTPVPAGHDKFGWDTVVQVLGEEKAELLKEANCCQENMLNMTFLALRFSRYVNGVAMKHGEVSRGMFPRYPIAAITNGVHAMTWTAQPFRELFDKHLPGWRYDNNYLRYAISISTAEMRQAHLAAKRALFDAVRQQRGVNLDENLFTIGFARRASTYKRADLLVSNPERLINIAHNVGPIQIIYAGKAHPHDEGGKDLIRRVHQAGRALQDAIKLVYVENYDLNWGLAITSGVDVWLNTPMRPQEASGTSGMKAAMNGVPSLSVLDGWWIEGHIEDVTGWSIDDAPTPEDSATEVASLYDKLERVVLPKFYGHPEEYARVMRWSIALNGAFFNTQRMVQQYIGNAYLPGTRTPQASFVAV
jgi:starch phosphorylase